MRWSACITLLWALPLSAEVSNEWPALSLEPPPSQGTIAEQWRREPEEPPRGALIVGTPEAAASEPAIPSPEMSTSEIWEKKLGEKILLRGTQDQVFIRAGETQIVLDAKGKLVIKSGSALHLESGGDLFFRSGGDISFESKGKVIHKPGTP